MDPYITGNIIRELREKKSLTQAELAERLNKTEGRFETTEKRHIFYFKRA